MQFWSILIVGTAILALLLGASPQVASAEGEFGDLRIVYLGVLVAAFVLAGTGRLLLKGGRTATRNTATIMLGTVAGLATAVIYRDEAAFAVHELRAKLMPSVAVARSTGELELRRDSFDGHYRALAEVNGVELELMIDTGASMVLIPYENALEIGINPETLNFSIPVTTANGRSAVAPIRLVTVRIGEISVFDLPAAVAQPGRLRTGLLGMSFLDQMAETTFRGDKLILRQKRRQSATAVELIKTGD